MGRGEGEKSKSSDEFPPQASGNDSGGGWKGRRRDRKDGGGEEFLVAVIPSVVGGEPSGRISRWMPDHNSRA